MYHLNKQQLFAISVLERAVEARPYCTIYAGAVVFLLRQKWSGGGELKRQVINLLTANNQCVDRSDVTLPWGQRS
jgi:hypothetical protein